LPKSLGGRLPNSTWDSVAFGARSRV
jgi:hypothetical protein